MINEKKVNVGAVGLIFFNRPETLSIVFEEIKKVKPKKLFLVQDGPRENNSSDNEKIEQCRSIVERVDWECDVYKNYSDKNLGCGLRPYTGINWIFGQVDSAIILEDDCVPNESFFYFCSEMLEKYNDDQRIFLVTGCNFEPDLSIRNQSYFFGNSGTNWGWATWKRVWNLVDYSLKFVDDLDTLNLLTDKLNKLSGKKGNAEIKLFIETNKKIKEGFNLSYWDVQWQSVRYLFNMLSIIPSKNLISNIGVGSDSTHAKLKHKSSRKKSFFYNERFDLDFPLKHPNYIIQNIKYDNKMDKRLYKSNFKKILHKIFTFH